MKIFVQAKPNARKECVEEIDPAHFIVFVQEPPIQGKANKAIIKLLADYFFVKPYQVEIIFGRTTRQKIIEIKK